MTKNEPRAISRLDQTLRTIRYVRTLKHPPLARWEILLILAGSTNSSGKPKPMSNAEISFATNTTNQNPLLATMAAEGDLAMTKRLGIQEFTLTLQGQDEAARIIQGVRAKEVAG